MRREIDGARIHSARDFHEEIGRLLDLGPYYGKNLDALWDRLSTDVDRPLTLVWRNAEVSRERLGDDFDRIVAVLERVQAQDAEWGLANQFTYQLE